MKPIWILMRSGTNKEETQYNVEILGVFTSQKKVDKKYNELFPADPNVHYCFFYPNQFSPTGFLFLSKSLKPGGNGLPID